MPSRISVGPPASIVALTLGAFVLLLAGCGDDDSSVGNEYQSLDLTNDELSLTDDPRGTVVDLGAYRDDADADPTNEIQSLGDVLVVGLDAEGGGMVNLGATAIGGATPHAGAALDIQSTTGALLLPRVTTAERDAITPALGMLVFNTDDMEFQGYGHGEFTSLELAEYLPWSIPRTVRNPDWVMHQSITVTEAAPMVSVAMLTDVDVETPGTFSILEGDGTTGTVLHTQPVTYVPCDSPICMDDTCTDEACETEFDLAPAFEAAGGAAYTLRFESLAVSAFSTWTSQFNAYDGGQVYQNAGAIPTEDMHLRITSGRDAWVSLQSP